MANNNGRKKRYSSVKTQRAKKAAEAEKEKETKKAATYKTFDDTTTDSHDFDRGYEEARDTEQKKFFTENSNYNELIESMSKEERAQFDRKWAPGRFMFGQQYGDFDDMSPDLQKATATFDKYLDQATLKEGVVLTRLSDAQLVLGKGHKRASLEELQAMEGRIITSKGSMSFCAASSGLTIGQKKNVEYKLSVPGGSTGAGMYIGDKRINFWGGKQREFMTNRDVMYKIGKTTYDKKRNMYTVNIEFQGLLEHEYGSNGYGSEGRKKLLGS